MVIHKVSLSWLIDIYNLNLKLASPEEKQTTLVIYLLSFKIRGYNTETI